MPPLPVCTSMTGVAARAWRVFMSVTVALCTARLPLVSTLSWAARII